MAFFALWLAANFMDNNRLKAVYGVLFCLVVYDIIFVVTGRSGYVIFLLLMIFFFYHYFDRKKFIIGAIIMGLLLSSTFFFANKFSERLLETKNNIQSCWQTGNKHTSVGERFYFARNSLLLFVKHPIIGYGTGSFGKEYKKLSQKTGTLQTDNPHDEYLAIAVQLGLVGLLMFIYLLAVEWKYAKTLQQHMVLAQGFVLTMAVGSLMNSMLMDAGEGHFFAYFSAVFFAHIKNMIVYTNTPCSTNKR
jgi:O-antigen ligase